MPASVAILAKPDDHCGILTMSEAVDAMLAAFRQWASDPLIAELRRRTHTPKNVRITLHQGAAPAYGTTGIMTMPSWCESSAKSKNTRAAAGRF